LLALALPGLARGTAEGGVPTFSFLALFFDTLLPLLPPEI
jgi:hypothetical protein